MFHKKIALIFVTFTYAFLAAPAIAQVSQSPLLNRPAAVAPNLALVLDTSGSMGNSYVYQYGTFDTSGNGYQGTGGNDSKSPDVNQIYYDPRVTYAPRIDYLGNPLTASAPSTSWSVYFRNCGSASCKGVFYDTGTSKPKYYTTSSTYTPQTTWPATVVTNATAISYPNSVTSAYLALASTKFPKFIGRTDCTTNATYCTATEEAQNNSNWNLWYSTRGKMAVTGLSAAFLPLADDSIRLAYGTIAQLNSNSFERGVGSFSTGTSGVRNAFYTWLNGLGFSGGTPNLVAVNAAGKYFERDDSDGPWATIPDPNSKGVSKVSSPSGPGKDEPKSSHASCRRSFSMLMTDGYWNGTVPSTAGNFDGNNTINILPAVGPAYVQAPAKPYSDSSSNTLADLAMYYWGRDLRTDLANRVPRINASGINNPSTWQNVSFYAVTLGLDGTLPRTAASLKLLSTTGSWPTPTANSVSTIDDTWHATINGRGELLNASNASELTNGLKKMFKTIAGKAQTLSGVAVSTTFLKNGTRKYKPEYIPGTWVGRLSAVELDAATGNDKVPTNVYWQVEGDPDSSGNPVSLIPAPTSRNAYTWSGTSGVAFDASSTGLSTDMVSYLLGDSSKESRNGGTYRNREAILGDIVNSSPVYIQDNVDLQYEKLGTGYGDYRQFVSNKSTRTDGVLFVGANDGFLHGFRNSNGREVFAYSPKSVQSKLSQLSDNNYDHQYYVDGPLVETDAYLNSTWKNIVLGTTGAGAKSVFAMDVTDPLTMTAANVMWEVNTSTSGFADLGYIFGDIKSGITPSGDWVAIFGNGIGNASGVARLYVVNLQTGALIKEISTGAGGGNGLNGVEILRDANQRIIGAYAGDLRGNMWKFDFTDTGGNWIVGLSGSPLYTAGSAQPITGAPAVLTHPNGGYMVSFGTGKFVATSDTIAPFAAQRLYGVWDFQPFDGGTTTTPSGASISGTSQLVQQTITTVSAGTPPVNFFNVSVNVVAWGNGLTGVRGWFINLPNSGERMVYPVQRLSGTIVLANTISPVSSADTDLCVQTGSGSGWAYIIDAITGSGPTKKVLDTNGDGLITDADALVSGWQDPVDGRPTAITIQQKPVGDKFCIVTAQNTCTKVELACGQLGMPACPQTPITGIKTREWRQIFMR